MISELTSLEEPRRHVVALMTGLDIHYELGEGHPLLGRRMPDLELSTTDGAVRVYELLHDARPLLLNLGAPRSIDIGEWADRVRLTDASHHGEWELPVIGVVSTPTAVLVRPDGYVAWVGRGEQQGLPKALTTWFGPPTATKPGPSPLHEGVCHHQRTQAPLLATSAIKRSRPAREPRSEAALVPERSRLSRQETGTGGVAPILPGNYGPQQ